MSDKKTNYWLKIAFERIKAGDKEEEVIADFGYELNKHHKSLLKENKTLSDLLIRFGTITQKMEPDSIANANEYIKLIEDAKSAEALLNTPIQD